VISAYDPPGHDHGRVVDLLVDLSLHMGLLGLGQVRADLEAILGTTVDLVPASDLKPVVPRPRRT
jgi:predicted nucleotidyltransferase